MGDNRWRDEPTWPLERAQDRVLYLTSGGKANTPAGDGRLLDDKPNSAGADRYTYDPADPVRSLHGPRLFQMPTDQRPLADRRDILVYQTEPLGERVEVTGYPEVELHAASSAPDTDFFVRLIDVHPDGLARDVSLGMVLRPISKRSGQAGADRAWQDGQVHDPDESDLERFSAGPPNSPGRVQQRLPQLRPQPQYGRQSKRRRRVENRPADHSPRRPAGEQDCLTVGCKLTFRRATQQFPLPIKETSRQKCKKPRKNEAFMSAPCRTRTYNPLIKSQML